MANILFLITSLVDDFDIVGFLGRGFPGALLEG
jgi:hypothetical protein